MALWDLTLTELRDAVATRRLGAEELVQRSLDRIAAYDPELGCFLETFAGDAAARAREVDRRIGQGDAPGPLAGLPIALKDNICLERGRTTCGSRMLEGYRSPFSATVAVRLEAAGAIIVGKTNLDEFAMGSSTEHSAFGPTRNPWDRTRVPGGSSGGSASAVAARLVPAALGSDTGGSVRQPGALCGVVGYKPTYGLVSRWGLVAYASSLDQIGPITRTVRDAALLAQVIAGPDPLDATSAPDAAPDLLSMLEHPVEGLRLGVPTLARDPGNHPDMARALDAAIAAFRGLGAQVVDVELPTQSMGVPAYYIVAPAEASSNLARFDGIRFGQRAEARPGDSVHGLIARSRAQGLGAEVQRRIMLGTFALSSGYHDAYYLTALKVRRRIKDEFDAVFHGAARGSGAQPARARGARRPDDLPHPEACHALLMPTTTGPAFKLGEKSGDPLSMYREDLYTVTANLAGLPAISVPAGFASVKGVELPLGVQILGPAFADALVLRVARMFEKATGHGARGPVLG